MMQNKLVTVTITPRAHAKTIVIEKREAAAEAEA